MGVIMRLMQKAKSLFLTTTQAVQPQTRTAVLSRTDAETGQKKPIYARPEIRNEPGLPSERFDPRQTSESKRVYQTPPTRPIQDR